MKLYNQENKYSQILSKSPIAVNYKTTIGGVITLLAYILPLFGVPIPPAVADALMAVGFAIFAWYAKDSDVTGGTKPQTKEAEDRITEQG